MTLHHPIFGVGPGDFSFVSWDERKAATGAGGESLVSHNTYTQISSETGLPGFFFFAASLVLSFRYAYRSYRESAETDTELSACARYLIYSSGALFAGIFFLSVGYTHILATFFALAAAIRLIHQRSLATASVTPSGTQRPVSAPPSNTASRCPLGHYRSSSTTTSAAFPSWAGEQLLYEKTFCLGNRLNVWNQRVCKT